MTTMTPALAPSGSDASATPTRYAAFVALTDAARRAIGHDYLVIDRFPFRVGRENRRRQSGARAAERRTGAAPTINDVYLTDAEESRCLSSEHFQIHLGEEGFVLVDRGSAGGTIVAGRVIGGRHAGGQVNLHDQDLVIVGPPDSPLVFRFRCG